MFRLLVDTCVWLDLARDPVGEPLLDAVEELIRRKELALIVPRTIVTEFSRNKKRVSESGVQSLTTAFKKVKEAVWAFDEPRRRRRLLQRLNDVDVKLPTLGETAVQAIGRIERLLAQSAILDVSEQQLARAAQRAVNGQAPFHRGKNSIGDALLIETYADCLREKAAGVRFGFVTHNKHDFSALGGDHRRPHPDIAPLFSKIKSVYFVALANALRRIDPTLVSEKLLMHEWEQEPRTATEISDAIDKLITKIWYDRHQVTKHKIATGQIRVVEKETYPRPRGRGRETIQRNVWEGAQRSAKRVERRFGSENLGPWSKFDWGMMNGKVSALRWVLGEEWDELYT